MLVKLDFDKTILLSPRHQPKSFKAIKCWNIQKENEFRKDSAWVIQWTVWRQNQIAGHQIRTDDQANKKEESLFFQETQEEFPTQFSTIQNQRKGCLHNFDSDSLRYGQDGHFVAITDIHFHQNWLSGAHIQFFWFLSVLLWESVLLKILRPFTYMTLSTYSFFLTNWFQKFDRPTWFNSRLNRRRTTSIISSWSTSTTNWISIIFRTLHKIKVIRILLGSPSRNHLNAQLRTVIRQRSRDWRRIWWSRGFFQAWN